MRPGIKSLSLYPISAANSETQGVGRVAPRWPERPFCRRYFIFDSNTSARTQYYSFLLNFNRIAAKFRSIARGISMHSAFSRFFLVITAATAVSAATSGYAAETTAAIDRSVAPPATIAELKAQYRRPETIPFPKDNPYTAEKAALGKKLYFDSRLSAANVLSCASCHSPAYGFGDGQPRGVGHGMKQLGRRSPTNVNAAFGEIFMWDGRAGSLEEQALGPIKTDVEMNLPIDQLLEKLKGISEYAPLFQAAFPKEGMKPETIAKAIATYERTV